MSVIKWEKKKATRIGGTVAVFIPKELHHIFSDREITMEWDGEKLIIYVRGE